MAAESFPAGRRRSQAGGREEEQGSPFRMIRIAIDMDEVIADTVTSLLAWYAGTYGLHWTREMLRGKGFRGLAPEEAYETMRALLHQGDFFETIPVMPGSQETVAAMMGRYEIFVASAAME